LIGEADGTFEVGDINGTWCNESLWLVINRLQSSTVRLVYAVVDGVYRRWGTVAGRSAAGAGDRTIRG
jgi:hypothetical protein